MGSRHRKAHATSPKEGAQPAVAAVKAEAPVDQERKGPVTYAYDPQRYLFDVRLSAYVSVVVLPVSCVLLVVGFLAPLMGLLAVVTAYTLLNTFVTHAYPRVVTRDGDVLTLESFGKTQRLDLAHVRRLSVRETPRGLKAYVRVDGGGIFKNRYFFSFGDMADEKGIVPSDVYQLLLDTEARLDPNGLRVRARRRQAEER